MFDALGRPHSLAGARVVPYDPATMRLRVASWLPLRVEAVSEDTTGLWLETRRLFVPGYRARVNGQVAPTGPSPIGLLAVALHGARPSVEIEYLGTPAMRVTYWLSLATWLGLGLALIASRESARA